MLNNINEILSGAIMPVLLMGAGLLFSARLKFFQILHPIRFFRTLKSGFGGGGQTPIRAMSIALAGTLGVGNIAGVASAIVAGGAGAVFWMWVSATLAMAVKYAEVALAVTHRRRGEGGWYGGAMYYIADTVSPVLGGAFAVLCIVNTIVTGNVIQANAAASVYSDTVPPIAVGIAMCVLALAVTVGPVKRISDVTIRLIPFLSAVYVALSLGIILLNAGRLPEVFGEIFSSAFDLRAVGGGVGGYGISRALRFGVTRGLLSNEAGCGTAPIAHASADTDSPHKQGVFGIFEVFVDTIVVCTLTAVVILLLPDFGGEDGVRLSVLAYRTFAGKIAGHVISASVILFAYATVVCQSYYGVVTLGYFTKSAAAKNAYLFVFAASCVIGSVIAPPVMWGLADLCVSLMTVLNVAVLLYLFADRKRRKEMLPGE